MIVFVSDSVGGSELYVMNWTDTKIEGGFEHEYMTFGLTNSRKRWFRAMKDRTKMLYKNTNCKDFERGGREPASLS